jgi:signal peptidase I
LAEFLIILLIAIVITSFVRALLIQHYRVPSESMEQTLLGTDDSLGRQGDTILTWKPGAPQRGDIVVFRDDLGWLGPLPEEPPTWKKVLGWIKVMSPPDEQYLVKRLIGLPGDHVTCCDASGSVTVNGAALDESQYLYYQNAAAAQIPFDLVVPEGRIFVMGDHRDRSADSRYHMCQGTQPTPELTFPSIDSIQGKVFGVMLPLPRLRTFSIPSAYADVPASTTPAPSPTAEQWTCPR